jgi:pimeloyl-ACP methyl ester carboxylesterase
MATFCLMHGAWHDCSCWGPLIAALHERGHDQVAPDLPLGDPEAGHEERARPALEALDGVSGTVVVVGHSTSSGYAAIVAARRPVSLLVHLCPRLGQLVPPPGAPAPFREGFPFPAEGPDGTSVWEPEAALAAMYPRLAPDVGRELAERRVPFAMPGGEFPLSAHPDVPTALVYAAEDEVLNPAWQRLMATGVLGVEPIEIPGGHFPMLEDPARTAELLDRLALEGPAPARR